MYTLIKIIFFMEVEQMPKAKRFHVDEIEKGKKILRDMAPKNEVLQAELISKLLPDILKVLDKGHSLKEVQKILSQGGIQLHMSKLRQAVDAARPANQVQKSFDEAILQNRETEIKTEG